MNILLNFSNFECIIKILKSIIIAYNIETKYRAAHSDNEVLVKKINDFGLKNVLHFYLYLVNGPLI